jgi:hypothetical protein
MKAFLLAAALAVAFIPNAASAASTCNGRLDCIHDNPVSSNVRSAVRSGGGRLHVFSYGRLHPRHVFAYGRLYPRRHHWWHR